MVTNPNACLELGAGLPPGMLSNTSYRFVAIGGNFNSTPQWHFPVREIALADETF
ncbi:DEKNAAC104363 [Brettanomyces naardenensis]|uniref:DEKNAAC104363 n=1 Tax=Brettanomyces naardenensis TaxID=13370 RepID=A0A448YQP5_BRENA|nr:DEKNAAC104363 [Brettanomyces naardenensis]